WPRADRRGSPGPRHERLRAPRTRPPRRSLPPPPRPSIRTLRCRCRRRLPWCGPRPHSAHRHDRPRRPLLRPWLLRILPTRPLPDPLSSPAALFTSLPPGGPPRAAALRRRASVAARPATPVAVVATASASRGRLLAALP